MPLLKNRKPDKKGKKKRKLTTDLVMYL
jgi:hypothetical protein